MTKNNSNRKLNNIALGLERVTIFLRGLKEIYYCKPNFILFKSPKNMWPLFFGQIEGILWPSTKSLFQLKLKHFIKFYNVQKST